jgi:DNA polymerase-3 subunit beta
MVAMLKTIDLKKALLAVKPAIPGKKCKIPVLNNILIESQDGDNPLTVISATNLEIGVTVCIPGYAGFNRATVPHKLILDIINAGCDDILPLDWHDYYMSVKWSARGTTTLKGIDADEFPPMPMPTDTTIADYNPPPVLGKIIKESYGKLQDESRYYAVTVNKIVCWDKDYVCAQ